MRRRQAFREQYLKDEAAKAVFFTPIADEIKWNPPPVFTEREQAKSVNSCHCGREFKTEQGLKIHKARAHGNAQ